MRLPVMLLGIIGLLSVGCAAAPREEAFNADEGEIDEAQTGFSGYQEHTLQVINGYRAKKQLPPLHLGTKLCLFARTGSKSLTHDHRAHHHFIGAIATGSVWNSGFTRSAGENQGDPNGWPVLSADPSTNKTLQIEDIARAMFAEGPGVGDAHGHYENMMNPRFRTLGVGFATVGGHLYFTTDFSE